AELEIAFEVVERDPLDGTAARRPRVQHLDLRLAGVVDIQTVDDHGVIGRADLHHPDWAVREPVLEHRPVAACGSDFVQSEGLRRYSTRDAAPPTIDRRPMYYSLASEMSIENELEQPSTRTGGEAGWPMADARGRATRSELQAVTGSHPDAAS